MKQSIFYIIIGILVIIGGLRYNEFRVIPEFLYYIFGGFAIVFGIYKLFTSATEDENK